VISKIAQLAHVASHRINIILLNSIEDKGMPQNQIQFQKGMSLSSFIEQYGTEEKCNQAFENARWGRSYTCPKCGAEEHTVFYRNGKKIWQCQYHKHQITVRSGTLFHASRVPLQKWFLAMYFMTQSKTNISALSLMRLMGVSYPTAWLVKHKLMQTMLERESSRKLSGRVVADDAYIGGVTTGGKRGRGAKTSGLFMAAVEVDDNSAIRYARFDRLPNLCGDSITGWAEKALCTDCHLVTDGYSSLSAVTPTIRRHQAIVVSPLKSSELNFFRWVNTVIGNLKTSMKGAYHGFKVSKYIRSYLAEAQYRFNRRFNLEPLVTRLLYACAQNVPRNLKWIRSAEPSC
jgi:ribosomal protein L37AE/L43A